MARKPRNFDSKEGTARVKAIKFKQPKALGALTTKLTVKQPAAPLSAARAARLASMHAQVRSLFGR